MGGCDAVTHRGAANIRGKVNSRAPMIVPERRIRATMTPPAFGFFLAFPSPRRIFAMSACYNAAH
ncbi:MAG: hypothetical protein JNM76_05555 [Betaproteobacteria bacterium]|nr:hypothetical protein [Betaproteobacteria bacterium]